MTQKCILILKILYTVLYTVKVVIFDRVKFCDCVIKMFRMVAIFMF